MNKYPCGYAIVQPSGKHCINEKTGKCYVCGKGQAATFEPLTGEGKKYADWMQEYFSTSRMTPPKKESV